MRNLKILLSAFVLFFSLESMGQEPILLENPSFEGKPSAGDVTKPMSIRGWYDCGFPGETPPDVHPEPLGGPFGVTQKPKDGQSYVGLVIRSNETYERIGQRLSQPLEGDKCYEFSIAISRSLIYKSIDRNTLDEVNYIGPIKLRIWAGNGHCERKEMLAESSLILHNTWKTYNFRFEPSKNFTYIMFEAFYQTPTPFPNNANILLDNASPIFPVPCDIEEPEIVAEVKQPDPEPKEKIILPLPPPKPEVKEKKEPKILKDLDRNKLKVGETIRMDQLFFKSDSSSITEPSLPVLNEVYVFLDENPDVVVEIGGHTNGIPPHDYCDRLSTARAKAVADYLSRKGIDRDRLKYKGYGKRKPIETNKSAYGRKRNQRVEVKILSFNG